MQILVHRYFLSSVYLLCVLALLLGAGCYHGPDEENSADKRFTARRQLTAHRRKLVGSGTRLPPVAPVAGEIGANKAQKPQKMARIGPEPLDPKQLMGNAACLSCHPTEYRSHHNSHHDSTIHEVTANSLKQLLPPVGAVREGGYQVVAKDQKRYFTQDGDVTHGQSMQYALGSGKSGMTYVHVLNADSLIELRMSYFPQKNQWYFTPGQMPTPDHAVGFLHQGPMGRACLACHTISLDARTGIPEPKYYGVGCESCHGPARMHVSAMNSGKMADLKIAKLGSWSATRLNRMCGQCHGNGDGFDPKNPAVAGQTNRFMAYGLMRSRCYLESNKSLSCVTCHNSHTDASKDVRFYENKCLQCHSSQTTLTPSIAQAPSRQPAPAVSTPAMHARTVCKVNPRTGCITCHMPTREVFPGLHLPTQMADHYISIKR